jgi:hypothetical protein
VNQANRPRRDGTGVPDAVYIGSEIHRRLAVTGSGGVDATVRVVVRKGTVWLSVEPPFTWEAIMTAAKVDELVRTLEIARDEARSMLEPRAVDEQRQAEA